MKRHYQRTYLAGRPTNGWGRGERITDPAQVKPGDVLISVCNQFQAENLVRVLPRELTVPAGFDYEYVDYSTLNRSDSGTMFCHGFELTGQTYEYYRAIDRRPGHRRIAKSKLPPWLSYAK